MVLVDVLRIDAVVNAAGVLQDSLRDDVTALQVTAMRALSSHLPDGAVIGDARRRAGVRRPGGETLPAVIAPCCHDDG